MTVIAASGSGLGNSVEPMRFEALALPDVKLIHADRIGDARGYFQEVWQRTALLDAGINVTFVQENQSLSRTPGTVRGLHFQTPPRAQHKLVRALRGSIFDVAVDLRASSPNYGKWVGVTLSAAAGDQIFVPVGFAHGFCTLEPDTEVGYLVTDEYSRENDAGILWNDPLLAIQWPAIADSASPSVKDRSAKGFAAFQTPF